jgi:hypothetical protein
MAYLETPRYNAVTQPIPQIGDKIQLLTCFGDYNHAYDNSIWKVTRINGRTISMWDMAKGTGDIGSIDVGGPWSWKILSNEWDE